MDRLAWFVWLLPLLALWLVHALSGLADAALQRIVTALSRLEL